MRTQGKLATKTVHRTKERNTTGAHSSERVDERGHVYFLVSGDFKKVKIGFSANVPARISSLNTATADELHLFDCFPCDKSAEKVLHRHFSGKHIKREWFRFDDEIDDFLADLEFARRDIIMKRVDAGLFRPKKVEEVYEALDAIPLIDILHEMGRQNAEVEK